MQPHQERVVEEKRELDSKIAKLSAFISNGEVFQRLPFEDRSLLLNQHAMMQSYSDILEQRIDRF